MAGVPRAVVNRAAMIADELRGKVEGLPPAGSSSRALQEEQHQQQLQQQQQQHTEGQQQENQQQHTLLMELDITGVDQATAMVDQQGSSVDVASLLQAVVAELRELHSQVTTQQGSTAAAANTAVASEQVLANGDVSGSSKQLVKLQQQLTAILQQQPSCTLKGS